MFVHICYVWLHDPCLATWFNSGRMFSVLLHALFLVLYPVSVYMFCVVEHGFIWLHVNCMNTFFSYPLKITNWLGPDSCFASPRYLLVSDYMFFVWLLVLYPCMVIYFQLACFVSDDTFYRVCVWLNIMFFP